MTKSHDQHPLVGDLTPELHKEVVESGIETEDDLLEHLKSVFKLTANTPVEIYEEDAERIAKELLDRHQSEEDPVRSAVVELVVGANTEETSTLENAAKWLDGNGESADEVKQRYQRAISAERTGSEEAGSTSLVAWEDAIHRVSRELDHEVHRFDEESGNGHHQEDHDDHPHDDDETEDPLAGDYDTQHGNRL